jgi:pyruvate dehydrogenase E2 component (dihydrolipoamide acetyltransferase)
MPFSVVMPALEMAQETGKLVSWRKKEGESVSKGEPLLEVETDKAVLEIECPADGILAGIRAHEGAVIPVGQTIAWIVRPGEIPPPEVAPGIASVPASIARTASAAPNARVPTNAAGARISPKARRLAKERGADLGRLRGSGPDGEILASDVLAAAESPGTAAPPPLETLSSIGRLMAERTTHSWTSVPHFFVVREVDAGVLIAVRAQLGPAIEKARGARVTHTDLLVALVSRALVKHPRLNASWSEGGIRLNPDINVSIAIGVNDGVVAAVIHSANTKDLGEIASELRELSERAQAGRLRPPDIAGATFTISNLGMYRVDAFSAIADRVVPVDGRPAIRPIMTMTLSCDHRVIDGVRAAAFLNDLAEAIRQPEEWLHR